MNRQWWCLVFIVLQFSWAAHAAIIDPILRESRKCSQLFSYFEKKYKIPIDTLHAISLVETGRYHSKYNINLVSPWAVNVEGAGYHFDSKREAVLFVKQQILSGKNSIDVGCMQINLKHHPDAFKTIEQAFDPIYNVRYAAEFLRSKYEQLGSWHTAIGHYHSATLPLAEEYRKKVFKIATNMEGYKNKLKQNLFASYSTALTYANKKVISAQKQVYYNRQSFYPYYRKNINNSNKVVSSSIKNTKQAYKARLYKAKVSHYP